MSSAVVTKRRVARAVAASMVPLSLLAVTNANAASSPDPALTSAISTTLNTPVVTSANVGVVVLDGTTNANIYRQKDTMMLSTASNEKSITSMTALEKLGPNFRFPTKVLLGSKPVKGVVYGNVYIKGYGDPSLSVDDLKAMAASLKASGVSKVTGRIIGDATYFDDIRYQAPWGDYSDVDNAQVAGLTLVGPDGNHDASIEVRYSGAGTGQPAKLTVAPVEAADYVTLVNKSVTKGSSDTLLTNRVAANSNTINVTGNVPATTSYRNLVAIDNPALYTAHVFRKTLAAAGVTVSAGEGTGAAPASAVLQQTHNSAPLSSILVPLMKHSNNTQTEQLLKTIGAVTSGAPGSWANGSPVLKATAVKAGASANELTALDGSGENPGTKATVNALSKMEVWAQTRPWFQSFYNALPVGAVDGTLGARFTGTAAAGKVHAKTGTLTGVTALSGYVTGADGHPYVFATISNYGGTSPRSVVDKMVVQLASWTKK